MPTLKPPPHSAGDAKRRKVIPLSELKAMCERQVSDEELCAWFGITLEDLRLRKKDSDFRLAISEGRGRGKVMLRSKVFALAMDGKHPSITIFAAKAFLGLKETTTVEHSGIDGKAIDITHTASTQLVNEFLLMAEKAKVNVAEPDVQSKTTP